MLFNHAFDGGIFRVGGEGLRYGRRNGWRNTVTDPEHMSAVELVREILSSDNEDWKTWS